ncbi:hypothetical protein [Burkholderia pseudomallei]|uniref:hypothetical protein n=1 Tax=Burkholderia pseudomallei TaxID=28450 RepID=UPI0015C36018|nr:hypothetical protein [Burkholderia pseudomallei]
MAVSFPSSRGAVRASSHRSSRSPGAEQPIIEPARHADAMRTATARVGRAAIERPSRRRPPRRQPSRDSGRRFFTSPKHAAPSTLPDKFRHCARGALSIFGIKSKTRAIRVNKNNLTNQWNIHKNNPQQSK